MDEKDDKNTTDKAPAPTAAEAQAEQPNSNVIRIDGKGKKRMGKPYRGQTQDPDRPLTPKQEAFVRHMLEGKNPSDAYRASYNTANMTAGTLHTEASKLVAHPAIAKRLRAGLQRKEEAALHQGLSLRRFVLDRLKTEALEADSDSARISALVALGKVTEVGLFTDRLEVDSKDRSPEEVRNLLEQKLKAAFGDS